MREDGQDKYIYYYLDRADIIADHVDDCLKTLYNNSYPDCDFENEILPKCKAMKDEGQAKGISNNEIFVFKDTENNKSYIYPLDFYYCPMSFQTMVMDNYMSAYGMERQWESNIDILKDYINNVDDRAVIEVHEEDENGVSQRTYKHIPDIKSEINKIINDDKITDDVHAKVMEYIDKCKNFYKFGLIDENQFRAGVAFHSPNSNPETVKAAWKFVYNKDIEIPDKSLWVDEFYDENEQ